MRRGRRGRRPPWRLIGCWPPIQPNPRPGCAPRVAASASQRPCWSGSAGRRGRSVARRRGARKAGWASCNLAERPRVSVECCQCSKTIGRDPATPGCFEPCAGWPANASDRKTQVAATLPPSTPFPSSRAEATTANLKRLHERHGNAYVALKQWQQAVDHYARAVTTPPPMMPCYPTRRWHWPRCSCHPREGPSNASILAEARCRVSTQWRRRAIAGAGRATSEAGRAGRRLFTQEPNQNWQRAVELYNKGITGNRSDADLLSRPALVYQALKNSDAAAADSSRAATGSPDGAKLLGEPLNDWLRRPGTVGNGRFNSPSTLRTITGLGP